LEVLARAFSFGQKAAQAYGNLDCPFPLLPGATLLTFFDFLLQRTRFLLPFVHDAIPFGY